MTSINAGTTMKVKKTKAPTPSVGIGRTKKVATKKIGAGGARTKKGAIGASAGASKKRPAAPPLQPSSLAKPEQIEKLLAMDAQEAKLTISDLVHHAFGERLPFHDGITKPHTASSTRDRAAAAADIAIACRELGATVVLRRYGVLDAVEKMIIPLGIGAVFGNADGTNPGGGMRKIASTASLTSFNNTDNTTVSSGDDRTNATDSKRGKSTPPNAREGSLLLLRALCQIVGKSAEPYVVPLLAAAIDEAASSNGAVREAAEDTSVAIIKLASSHAVPKLICPVLFEALHSPEWRVKALALDSIAQCASKHPAKVSKLLPVIIPIVTAQVWDTKAQVTKAASSTLLAACNTNINPDVLPAIPAVVNAIVKPAETLKAVDELMATTFVATVDASTLSILCPILSRGLKEKNALHQRKCCVVIENMSRLVDSPEAVAPFGPLLVPELKKVAENVQFSDIRDAALAALNALTKALGHADIESAVKTIMQAEAEAAEAEQKRIQAERDAEKAKEEENRIREEEERRQFREAMEAQRLLDKLALQEEEEKKAEEDKKKEKQKLSTKSAKGTCQGCGLKKCKKSCLFYVK